MAKKIFVYPFFLLYLASPLCILDRVHADISGASAAIASTFVGEASGEYPTYGDTPSSGTGSVFATKADVMISSAESFIRSGELSRALDLAAQVTAEYPDYVPGWMLLGYCRSLSGEYMASNLAYEKALSMGADPKDVYKRTAYNYMKMENWDAARSCYEEILEVDEEDEETLCDLAALELRTGQADRALYYYSKALELDPNDTKVLVMTARIQEKMGRLAEAEALLDRALAVSPDESRLLRLQASVLMKEKKYDKAIPILEKLVAETPDNTTALTNLGIALYQSGRKSEAAVHFEKVAELGGAMQSLYGPLADCLLEKGDTKKALAYIKLGIENGKQLGWLYSLWGKILERMKDYDGAIAKFSLAARLGEDPWPAYARKQIERQKKLKRREELLLKQAAGM